MWSKCRVPALYATARALSSSSVVAVGVSGGVDSSVAALLLKQQGHRVIGVYMRNWDELDESGQCSGDADRRDAQRVCDQIGIDFHEVSFVREYWNCVFSPMVEGRRQGTTPNPDVACNTFIKFDALARFSREKLAADYLATGHYARLTHSADGSVLLLSGVDANKDQSYFLSRVREQDLRRVLFPLGAMRKADVRRIARDAGLPTAGKRSSAGLCFVGRRDFKTFLQEYIEPRAGVLCDTEGRQIGTHNGQHLYTVGQSARIGGLEEKLFVTAKDAESNTVVVAGGPRHPALFRDEVDVKDMMWFGGPPLAVTRGEPLPCLYRLRHRAPPRACTVVASRGNVDRRSAEENVVRVRFDRPQSSLAPGQVMALYVECKEFGGERVLGGGIIAGLCASYAEQRKPVPADAVL